MRTITLQVLEGLERGQTYQDLPIPVSIGREEENTIRLNDERISRFHAKLQEDGGRTILTDLGSTNGTRVNGRPVQMRILKPGDQINIGRCLLLFGSQEEIRARMERDRGEGTNEPDDRTIGGEPPNSDDHEQQFGVFADPMPELPQELTTGQRAQLADFLAHVHDEIRLVASSSEELLHADEGIVSMRTPGAAWQRLLQLEMDLAIALRRIVEPDFATNESWSDHDETPNDS